jgi:hypothetical protein
MFNNRSFAAVLIIGLFLSACGPAQIVPPAGQLQPLPSPTESWQLSFVQSGGFAGVQLKLGVSSDGRLTAQDLRSGKTATKQLDAATLNKISGLVSTLALSASQSPGSACADCFLYDLQLTTGGRTIQVHADDTTLAASGAQDLIALLQQLRDGALKSAS